MRATLNIGVRSALLLAATLLFLNGQPTHAEQTHGDTTSNSSNSSNADNKDSKKDEGVGEKRARMRQEQNDIASKIKELKSGKGDTASGDLKGLEDKLKQMEKDIEKEINDELWLQADYGSMGYDNKEQLELEAFKQEVKEALKDLAYAQNKQGDAGGGLSGGVRTADTTTPTGVGVPDPGASGKGSGDSGSSSGPGGSNPDVGGSLSSTGPTHSLSGSGMTPRESLAAAGSMATSKYSTAIAPDAPKASGSAISSPAPAASRPQGGSSESSVGGQAANFGSSASDSTSLSSGGFSLPVSGAIQSPISALSPSASFFSSASNPSTTTRSASLSAISTTSSSSSSIPGVSQETVELTAVRRTSTDPSENPAKELGAPRGTRSYSASPRDITASSASTSAPVNYTEATPSSSAPKAPTKTIFSSMPEIVASGSSAGGTGGAPTSGRGISQAPETIVASVEVQDSGLRTSLGNPNALTENVAVKALASAPKTATAKAATVQRSPAFAYSIPEDVKMGRGIKGNLKSVDANVAVAALTQSLGNVLMAPSAASRGAAPKKASTPSDLQRMMRFAAKSTP